ncbi:MAG: hypothetical protein QXL67_02570 [Candidatus Bathyarchaeia archaeon]
MKTKIAVATVSGKAYYLIVKELERLNVPFMSLRPWDDIPMGISVVITTDKEKGMVTHHTVVALDEGSDPSKIVSEAVKVAMEGSGGDTIILGIDPGKTYGLALLVGGKVYEASTHNTLGETLKTVLTALDSLPFPKKIIRIGGGAQPYTDELTRSLDELLPRDVAIEIVDEKSTSKTAKSIMRMKSGRDASSAVIIAMRSGKPYQRKRH